MREVLGLSSVKPSANAPKPKKYTEDRNVKMPELHKVMAEQDAKFSHIRINSDVITTQEVSPMCRLMEPRFRKRVHDALGQKGRLLRGAHNRLVQMVVHEKKLID